MLKYRWLATIGISTAALVVVACGGGGDDGDSDSNGSESQQTSATATSTSSASDNGSSSGLAPDSAVVVIGEKRYEFDMTSPFADACLTLFGVVGGSGQAVDGSDVSLSIEVPPENYKSNPNLADLDPPSLRVKDDDSNQDWRAGGLEDLFADGPPAGSSQVDSYSNDGNRASGTATFVDTDAWFLSTAQQTDRPEPVKGSFEIHCE